MLKKLFQDEKGEDMVEYALLTALISVVLIATLGLLKDQIKAVYDYIIDALEPPA
jgi:Flp pilus assembly pilin Flp